MSEKEKEWKEFQRRVKMFNQQRDVIGFTTITTPWIKLIIKKEVISKNINKKKNLMNFYFQII